MRPGSETAIGLLTSDGIYNAQTSGRYGVFKFQICQEKFALKIRNVSPNGRASLDNFPMCENADAKERCGNLFLQRIGGSIFDDY